MAKVVIELNMTVASISRKVTLFSDSIKPTGIFFNTVNENQRLPGFRDTAPITFAGGRPFSSSHFMNSMYGAAWLKKRR